MSGCHFLIIVIVAYTSNWSTSPLFLGVSLRRFHYCASSFFYHPSASAAALSRHYILSLNYIFQEWVKRLHIFFHLLCKTQIAPRHHDIKCVFFPFCTQGHCCTPSRRQAAPVWQRLPTSLGAQCQSRAEEENSSVGAACCHVENNSRRMEKGRVRCSLYSKLSQAAEKKKIHFITWFHTTVFFLPVHDGRWKIQNRFHFLCLDPLKSPHHWNQVIVLLAQFLQPSDATDCNRLHL